MPARRARLRSPRRDGGSGGRGKEAPHGPALRRLAGPSGRVRQSAAPVRTRFPPRLRSHAGRAAGRRSGPLRAPAAPNLPPCRQRPLAPTAVLPAEFGATSGSCSPIPRAEPASVRAGTKPGRATSPATKPEPDSLPAYIKPADPLEPASPPSPCRSEPSPRCRHQLMLRSRVRCRRVLPPAALAAPVGGKTLGPPAAPRGWRALAVLMTSWSALVGLVAAWRFAPERVPPMLQPVELLRAVGITVSPGRRRSPPPNPSSTSSAAGHAVRRLSRRRRAPAHVQKIKSAPEGAHKWGLRTKNRQRTVGSRSVEAVIGLAALTTVASMRP